MRGTVFRDWDAGRPADGAADAAGTDEARWGGPGRWVVAVVLLVLAAGAVIAWSAGAFQSRDPAGTGQDSPPPATRPVMREDLSSTTPVNATLGYAGSYTVTGHGPGTLTWLPSAGQVIGQGQALYRVDNGTPVVLLYGDVPAWRTLGEKLTGADVTELNHDLVDLGYASSPDITALGWDFYSWETKYAVQQLEAHLGVSNPPGTLTLGSVVFEPEALRVSDVTGGLGNPASGPVFSATSSRRAVTINLSTSQEPEVAAGDPVSVTLPDGVTTPGVITSVGAVASGSGSSATIPVMVRLRRPSAAGRLDQAPVTVNIATVSSHGPVLAVPVGALLAQSSGGYAVEVAGAGNARGLVPVRLGIFADSSGLVQVTGPLTPGEHVVVPAT